MIFDIKKVLSEQSAKTRKISKPNFIFLNDFVIFEQIYAMFVKNKKNETI